MNFKKEKGHFLILDFIKYLPFDLQWRRNDHYCVPKGPSFARAQHLTLAMAGNRLHLKVPRHRPSLSGIKQVHALPKHDVLADPRLRDFSSALMPNDHWGYANSLARRWAFWGPWLSGCRAELSMGVAIIGRQSEHAFQDISFFHPRAFEMVIVQYLNDLYGDKFREGDESYTPRYHGPMDWRTHNLFTVFSASCKIYKRTADLSRLFFPEHFFFFPISEKHFVQVGFLQHIYSTDKKNNPAFDISPIQELQDAIFNSIRLELSPEHQASYDKIKAEIGDMELTKEFAPLKWPVQEKRGEDCAQLS